MNNTDPAVLKCCHTSSGKFVAVKKKERLGLTWVAEAAAPFAQGSTAPIADHPLRQPGCVHKA